MRDQAGEITHFIAIKQDVTGRKRAEEALIESQGRLRDILEHSTNIFYSHTAEHQLTYMSPQTRELLGYEPEETLVRWTTLTTDHPVNALGYERTCQAIETGERPASLRAGASGQGGAQGLGGGS